MDKTNQTYDVIILGGGAGGMFAAIVAAKKGKKVLVLEKSNKVGKKILMSGGGRCNFTNQFTAPKNFLSKNSHFCKSALSQYTAEDFINMVQSHDIDYETRKHGQLFCINSAKDIVEMLVNECESYGVKILTHASTTTIDYLEDKKVYKLNINIETKKYSYSLELSSSSLIVATGALGEPTSYPNIFAWDTTLERSAELSKNISFANIFALKPR